MTAESGNPRVRAAVEEPEGSEVRPDGDGRRPAIGYLRLGSGVSAHMQGIIGGLRELGWTVTVFEPAGGRGRWIRRLWNLVAVQIKLWRAGHDLDAIYVRHHPGVLPTVLWARARGIPTIQELNGPYEDPVMGTRIPRPLAALIVWLVRRGIRASSAVVVVSPAIRKTILEHGDHRNVHVIPNAAEPRVFTPQARTAIRVPAPYVAWFGFMGWWQGIDTTLDAIARPEWPVGLRLVMMGDGPERARVEEAARRDPRILYLGQLPPADVAALVAGSVAGLSPQNDREGRSSLGMCPIKQYETMACGVPIIVTDFPGHADVVREGRCGLVVPADDPAALARAVAELWRDEAARREMGRRGRRLVEAEHSWYHRARSTAEVIGALLPSGRFRSNHGS